MVAAPPANFWPQSGMLTRGIWIISPFFFCQVVGNKTEEDFSHLELVDQDLSQEQRVQRMKACLLAARTSAAASSEAEKEAAIDTLMKRGNISDRKLAENYQIFTQVMACYQNIQHALVEKIFAGNLEESDMKDMYNKDWNWSPSKNHTALLNALMKDEEAARKDKDKNPGRKKYSHDPGDDTGHELADDAVDVDDVEENSAKIPEWLLSRPVYTVLGLGIIFLARFAVYLHKMSQKKEAEAAEKKASAKKQPKGGKKAVANEKQS